jgi:dTDP-4-amino-4,6-dideoxygalactose transaminase
MKNNNMEKLAILGADPSIKKGDVPIELFKWPIITKEDEEAVLDVVRNNKFSGTDITTEFQEKFAKWQGREYALAFTNGTMSIGAAMFAIGLSAGDEIICPTKTYWGSVSLATNFGATAVFCNINDMLSMDPDDLERCITPKTKAIMVVHYFGYPCDMDKIMAIARKHNLYVIEDLSHSHGCKYKGKKVGTFGDIAAMSMMSWKGFAAGEMGMLVTDDRKLYERAIAYGHYERNNEKFIKECKELLPYSHIALGGVKGRTNQVCAALGLGQLKYFDERCVEIRKAMNYFCDEIDKLPGLKAVRCDESDGSSMGAFYSPQAAYYPKELGGLSSKRFAEAIRAESDGSFDCWEGGNFCLHNHPFFKDFDFLGLGRPSRNAFSERDAREDDKYLAPSLEKYCVSLPWFKKFDKEWIDKYIAVFKKVCDNYESLLEGDTGDTEGGRWYGSTNDGNQQKKKK